jgi:WD40 repeat protein
MSAQQWQIVGYTTEGTLSIALDGSKLAYVGPSGDIYVVDLPSMSQTASIATAASVIRRLAWSSDSTRLAGIEADHLWVWGMAEISLDLPGMDLRGLSWSPDDRFLAVASAQPSLLVLDTTTWAQTSTLELSPEVPPADDIAWAPSGQLLAGRGGDRVWIWDMTTGEVVMDEECEAAADIAWSPDAGLLAAPCDGIIHVWRVNEGYQDHDVPLYYWARIDDVSWSPDSNRLAAGTSDGLTMIWDVSGGEILGRMRDFVGSTDTIAWSTGGPSGEFLISASAADGLVLIRAVP